MKIIQILPELNAGGVERGTLEIGRALVQKGHDSLVISNGGRLVNQLEQEGTQHIQLPVHKKRLSSLKQVKALRVLFEKEKPNIIHLRSRLPAWLPAPPCPRAVSAASRTLLAGPARHIERSRRAKGQV